MIHKLEKLENIAHDCVSSWPKDELYLSFNNLSESIHSLEKQESLSIKGKEHLQNIEHLIVKLFATKYNADISILS